MGDDSFALGTYLMMSYSQRGLTDEQLITNYRFTRGRRVVENAFCILAQKWQLLLTTMMQQPRIVRVIVECCVCIRYSAQQNNQLDIENEQHELIRGVWRANANLHDVNMFFGPNRETIETLVAKKQKENL